MVLSIKTLIPTFLIFLALAAGLALLAVKVLDWSEYHHLARNAIKTVGHVTSKEPENHNFVRYSFRTDHRSFSGLGSAGGENPEFEQLEIGTQVNVYYDPQNPSLSFLGNPKQQAESATRGVIFTSLVGSLLSMVGMYLKGWLPICEK
jgi:hypothetical protein